MGILFGLVLTIVIWQGTALSSHEYSINHRAPHPAPILPGGDSSSLPGSISTSTALTESESTSATSTTTSPLSEFSPTSSPTSITSILSTLSTHDSISTSISTTDTSLPTPLSIPIPSTTTSPFMPPSSVSSSTSSSTPSTTFTVSSNASDDINFTVTQIVANPTNVAGSAPISNPKQGFFSNVGAVAGAFVVIGLFATMFFICLFLWAARKYRVIQRKRDYFNDEYKEFNHSMERGPALVHTVSAPAPDRMESQILTDISPQYRAEPGEFDPYQPQSIAYAYSDDYADYSEYERYLDFNQREVAPFIENTRN